jgi:hypothetical protein
MYTSRDKFQFLQSLARATLSSETTGNGLGNSYSQSAQGL